MHGREFDIFNNGTDCDLSGIKQAQVVTNADPTAQERVFVRVLGVHDMSSTDVNYGIPSLHCAPSRNSSGEIPEVGDWLWVMFPDITNPAYCIYLGFVRHSS